MGRTTALAMIVLLAAACGQGTSAATHSPGVSASPSARSSPPASPSAAGSPSPTALSGSYGLLLSAGQLELIRPDATVAASASVAAPSVQYCSSASDGAVQPPPVSASSTQVYFRDGDTKIRMVVPPAGAADVTTVPGGPTTISFFSVSPDDQRIAVLVEDLSAATTIGLRLYVEDLRGGGNHSDIFTTTTPKGKTGTTLWPMGWHQGALVLAVVTACTFEPAGLSPSEWHVSSATTAVRIATIAGSGCILSYWPSPVGVACVSQTRGSAAYYDWTGKNVAASPVQASDYQSSLSPSGRSVMFSTGVGIGAPSPAMRLVNLGPGPYATLQGHTGCLWIDEDHVLAPDAVITFPSTTPGNAQVTATAAPLTQSGVCAGRFPGGL